jgi:hypothetical protein
MNTLLLLLQGLGLLQPGSPLVKFRAALEVFDEACKLEPSFAEVSRKAHCLCDWLQLLRSGVQTTVVGVGMRIFTRSGC